jgi:Ca-activated chloride channel family protein
MAMATALLFLAAGMFLGAQDVFQTQVDTAQLFTLSRINCYVSVEGLNGPAADNPEFEAFHETSKGMVPVRIVSVKRHGDTGEGMTFFLLLDNSGSMYLPIGGESEGTRMDHALRGIQAFLTGLDNPADAVGFGAFNTLYTPLAEPSGDMRVTGEALATVKQPDDEMAYTEIYWSLIQATGEIARFKGRKAIIILSDGENYPYSSDTGKAHPEIGNRIYLPDEALKALEQEEITLYVINFAPEKDEPLARIALESGGMVFDARDEKELTGVYRSIKESIEKEYRITLRVPLTFIGNPDVEIRLAGGSSVKSYSPRFIFGKPGTQPFWFFLIFLAVALLVWALLMLIRLEKPATQPELKLLTAGSGKAPQRTLFIQSDRTVIGGAPQADFTVAGIPSIKDSHATIIQDAITGTYTLISDATVMVNNKPVTNRKLVPGDVINVEGATIIFDAPVKKK